MAVVFTFVLCQALCSDKKGEFPVFPRKNLIAYESLGRRLCYLQSPSFLLNPNIGQHIAFLVRYALLQVVTTLIVVGTFDMIVSTLLSKKTIE